MKEMCGKSTKDKGFNEKEINYSSFYELNQSIKIFGLNQDMSVSLLYT
jgi:hypothetical protein